MLICPPPLDWNGMRGPVSGGGRKGELFGSPAWLRSDKERPSVVGYTASDTLGRQGVSAHGSAAGRLERRGFMR